MEDDAKPFHFAPKQRRIASGVTARGAKPVPPVVRMTSTPGYSPQVLMRAWIASMSSVTIARAARLWPAATSRSHNSAPDVSVSAVRVSDTVKTAIFSGCHCLRDILPNRSAASCDSWLTPIRKMARQDRGRLDTSLNIEARIQSLGPASRRTCGIVGNASAFHPSGARLTGALMLTKLLSSSVSRTFTRQVDK